MPKSLKFVLSALALLAATPAHADEATFWFTGNSQHRVVLKFEDGVQYTLSTVNQQMPEDCRGDTISSNRNRSFEGLYFGLPIQDYSTIRDTLAESNAQGSQWTDTQLLECGRQTALVCLRSVGGKACGVVHFRY